MIYDLVYVHANTSNLSMLDELDSFFNGSWHQQPVFKEDSNTQPPSALNFEMSLNFKVAETSTDVSLTDEAAPTTEAVSCIARAAQAPNCLSLNSKYSLAKGNNKTAIAFKIKIIVIAAVKSSDLALIDGATEAMAVPPQIDVPEANK